MKLAGKAALVTGGGRGIGRSIALALAQEGADVCVTARSAEQIEAVAAEVASGGRRSLAVTCDITDRQQVEQSMQRAFEAFSRLDIVVNNAGGGQERTKVGEDDPDAWAKVIELNLTGSYYCCRAALPWLRRSGGGAIINVGSGMGHAPRVGNSSYNAAKAGLWMLTRCLAMEVWEDGIAVNEIVPGPVHTELTAAVFSADSPHPSIPSEWVKHPDDVAPLAVMLASQGRHGPTGQSFSLARRPL